MNLYIGKMDWKELAGVLNVPLHAGDQARVISPLESLERAIQPLRERVQLDTPMWTPAEPAE